MSSFLNIDKFESIATNLNATDTTPQADVYVHDRQTNKTELVSRSYDGGQSNGASGAVDISSNGQYIVFQSGASNITDDVTGTSDNHIYRASNPLYAA